MLLKRKAVVLNLLNYKKIIGLVCVILLLTACKNKELKSDSKTADNYFKIYYLNNSEDKLVSEDYFAKENTVNGLIKELLLTLREVPDGITLKKPLPDEVKVNSYKLTDKVLTIDFSEAYKELTGISEVLRRASVVKTLCQINGVDKVQYTIQGQPLMYSEENPIGAMAGEDFIDNTGGETTYYQTVQISLYYTNAAGDKLVHARHNVEFDGTISLEKLVLNQLLAGPLETEQLFSVLPPGTKINKVSYKDGICYVDLSKEFLEGREGVSDEVIIYSIVNSLTDIGSVTKVQLFIDGKTQATYRGTIPIDLPIERELNIIETN